MNPGRSDQRSELPERRAAGPQAPTIGNIGQIEGITRSQEIGRAPVMRRKRYEPRQKRPKIRAPRAPSSRASSAHDREYRPDRRDNPIPRDRKSSRDEKEEV